MMLNDIADFIAGSYTQGRLIAAQAGTILSIKSVLTLVALGILALAEYWRPAVPAPEKTRLRRWGRNLGLWALNIPLSIYIVLPITAMASFWTLSWRPDWLGGWQGIVLDLLILDLFIYLWHRANHEVPFLWRFHRVHHYDRFLDTSTALRFHWGEVFLSALARGAIIVLADIGFESVVLYEGLLLCAALFQHSNLRIGPRTEAILSRFMVTPSIHWVHHHATRADTDSNYATGLSLWDRLFGTRSPTHRTATMPIGIENAARDPSFVHLLGNPFTIRS